MGRPSAAPDRRRSVLRRRECVERLRKLDGMPFERGRSCIEEREPFVKTSELTYFKRDPCHISSEFLGHRVTAECGLSPPFARRFPMTLRIHLSRSPGVRGVQLGALAGVQQLGIEHRADQRLRALAGDGWDDRGPD